MKDKRMYRLLMMLAVIFSMSLFSALAIAAEEPKAEKEPSRAPTILPDGKRGLGLSEWWIRESRRRRKAFNDKRGLPKWVIERRRRKRALEAKAKIPGSGVRIGLSRSMYINQQIALIWYSLEEVLYPGIGAGLPVGGVFPNESLGEPSPDLKNKPISSEQELINRLAEKEKNLPSWIKEALKAKAEQTARRQAGEWILPVFPYAYQIINGGKCYFIHGKYEYWKIQGRECPIIRVYPKRAPAFPTGPYPASSPEELRRRQKAFIACIRCGSFKRDMKRRPEVRRFVFGGDPLLNHWMPRRKAIAERKRRIAEIKRSLTFPPVGNLVLNGRVDKGTRMRVIRQLQRLTRKVSKAEYERAVKKRRDWLVKQMVYTKTLEELRVLAEEFLLQEKRMLAKLQLAEKKEKEAIREIIKKRKRSSPFKVRSFRECYGYEKDRDIRRFWPPSRLGLCNLNVEADGYLEARMDRVKFLKKAIKAGEKRLARIEQIKYGELAKADS